MAPWDELVDAVLTNLAAKRHLFNTRLITLAPQPAVPQTFAGPGPWDRATIEMYTDGASVQQWLTINGEACIQDDEVDRKLILFSGNDYMCLSSHPAIRDAAVKAAQEHGMGPRGSPLACGYTTYHKLVEESLAQLMKKQDCILCTSGYSANTAVMSAVGSVSSLLAVGRKPTEDERIAIFSDASNHASIIDGIRHMERMQEGVAFVYKHRDMSHLESLLSSCSIAKKLVVTDSIFSMGSNFAPLPQLVELREKYGFLLLVDDAHGTFVYGENGGGAPELFGCQDDIDIVVSSLSKAAGCMGGFIACSTRWKRLILSRGRSLTFSTALPVPVVASVHAAIHVSKMERWRRSVLLENTQYFASLTELDIYNPIISVVVGSEDTVLKAHSHLLRSGFLVEPIRPPVVPPNTCRLRITLSTAHSSDDIKRLVDALKPWLPVKQAR
ncbi:hypothetical protein BS78_09G055700 [Paspalum vaginatum]|nr:hypothetical protein BS78_09G055700 [Paspalum vaginatum]KAJ1261757.1 hypothetical protein BS78_09G055700 [Paspalum vaginatum]KAJ1261759.1 hypothetical protein BS78_09G055700 [Paspalum vaginatum]KAJ1261760.1 hypothetical protein BS78_09G055700 [Paspalum vaginatum]